MVRVSYHSFWIVVAIVCPVAYVKLRPIADGAGRGYHHASWFPWLPATCMASALVAIGLKWAYLSRFRCPHCGRRYMTFLKEGFLKRRPHVWYEPDINLRCGHCGIVFGTLKSNAIETP